jgi:hypothetical protein
VHLLLGDLAVLGFIGAQELIESSQPTIMIGLQAQGIVYPRTHAPGPAMGNRLLGYGYQLSINGCRKPLL